MGRGLWSKMSSTFSGSETEAEAVAAERQSGKTNNNFRFAVYNLSSPEDSKRAADAMKIGNGVVVNGENLDEIAFQRALDFLDGAAHVLGVVSRNVSGNVQVYTPAGMDVTDDAGSYYGNLTSGKKRLDV